MTIDARFSWNFHENEDEKNDLNPQSALSRNTVDFIQ